MSSQTTSGTRKRYKPGKMFKPGQLLTINNKLFRVMKKPLGARCCEGCYFRKDLCIINKGCYLFCDRLPGNCKFVLNSKLVK